MFRRGTKPIVQNVAYNVREISCHLFCVFLLVGCASSGCGGNGKCKNGVCVCDEGWKGADCSKSRFVLVLGFLLQLAF